MYISIQTAVIVGSPLHRAVGDLGGLQSCRPSDLGEKSTGILSIIIRTESTTRMDAELVQRSKEIHQRLKQLGDSL